jgi:hypothetical protein
MAMKSPAEGIGGANAETDATKDDAKSQTLRLPYPH